MNQRKKTVVILTPGFAKDEQDTTCLPFLQDYVTTLMKARPDINIQVVAFQYPYKEGCYKWNGVSVYSAGGKNAKYISRLFCWRRVLKQLKKINNNSEIDMIHSFWLTEATLIGQRFAKKHNIRHIAYAIGQDVLNTSRYLSLLDYNQMKVVAMSGALAERFKTVTGKDVQGIIASGINTSKLEAPATEKTIDIIGVGALTELKNYSLFIDIITALKMDIPGIKACIIGTGPQEQVLKQKANKLKLDENVKFLGEVEHKDVFSYMGKSKIFLHTSGYEGQSTVMLEALAMGCNIVCFDVGRLHAEGKIVVCKDKDGMIQQVYRLLSSTLDNKPLIVRKTEDMVNDFVKLYEV